MTSADKALKKKKIGNMVKGNEGKVDDKGKKAKKAYSFQVDEGAKNNDSETD